MIKIKDLGIGYKIVIVITLAALLPLFAVGYYSNVKSSEALEANALSSMDFGVQEISSRINSFINVVKQDAVFIKGVPPVQGIIRARDNNGFDAQGGSTTQQWMDRLGSIYSNFGKSKPYYLQLRYINETGKEMVRVDFDEARATMIPQKKLQNKAKSSYFRETMKLPAGQVYVSAFNLNREAGQIEVPHKPVVRFGVPVFDKKGKRRGVVVLNVLGQGILNYVPEGENGVQGHFYLANSEGYYLYHKDNNKTWGFDLNRPDKLFNDMSGLAHLSTTNIQHGRLTEGDLDMAYALVHPNPENKNIRWILVNAVPRSVILSSVADFQNALYLLALVSLVITISFGLWLSRSWFVSPLTNILQVLNSFAGGNLSVRVQGMGKDEVGQVGNAFNNMAQEQEKTQQREREQAERERLQLEELRKAADISERVEVLRGHIEKVANGDLRDLIDAQGDDDLAQLGAHLNGMTTSLAEVSSDIRGMATQISSTVAELSNVTNSQAAAATQQASSISETTTTLQEIKSTSLQTLDKAQALGSSAERTKLESSQGLVAVQQSIAGMESIRKQVEEIANTIQALQKQNQQIGEITEVVNDLALQSKILAMNASIEAAKAGEAGKGFAVVAGEVKELAEQSQESTDQVQKILQDIHTATDLAVKATKEGSEGMDNGISLVERTGEVMQALSEVIQDTMRASEQIVAAVRQEASGIDQVTHAMTDINKSVQTFVSSSRQTKDANQELSVMAKKLRDSVSVYKT